MRIEKILTQHELTIDLSIPAMEHIAFNLEWHGKPCDDPCVPSVRCEIDNFRNTLLNLIERGVDKVPATVLVSPPEPGNLDLIGG